VVEGQIVGVIAADKILLVRLLGCHPEPQAKDLLSEIERGESRFFVARLLRMTPSMLK
jgi:hypothetical protein